MINESFKGYFSGRTFAKSIVNLPFILSEFNLDKVLRDGTFVDLGCGLGDVLAEYQNKYPNLKTIGVDINKDYLAEAKKRSPKSSFIKSLLSKLPIPDNSIDVVFSSKIYQLCNENSIEPISQEIYRILKPSPNGFYLMTVEDFYPSQELFLDKFRKIGFNILQTNGMPYTILEKN